MAARRVSELLKGHLSPTKENVGKLSAHRMYVYAMDMFVFGQNNVPIAMLENVGYLFQERNRNVREQINCFHKKCSTWRPTIVAGSVMRHFSLIIQQILGVLDLSLENEKWFGGAYTFSAACSTGKHT